MQVALNVNNSDVAKMAYTHNLDRTASVGAEVSKKITDSAESPTKFTVGYSKRLQGGGLGKLRLDNQGATRQMPNPLFSACKSVARPLRTVENAHAQFWAVRLWPATASVCQGREAGCNATAGACPCQMPVTSMMPITDPVTAGLAALLYSAEVQPGTKVTHAVAFDVTNPNSPPKCASPLRLLAYIRI